MAMDYLLSRYVDSNGKCASFICYILLLFFSFFITVTLRQLDSLHSSLISLSTNKISKDCFIGPLLGVAELLAHNHAYN